MYSAAVQVPPKGCPFVSAQPPHSSFLLQFSQQSVPQIEYIHNLPFKIIISNISILYISVALSKIKRYIFICPDKYFSQIHMPLSDGLFYQSAAFHPYARSRLQEASPRS